MSVEHRFIPVNERHAHHAWEVNSEAERLALDVVSMDIGKIVWQKDNNSEWKLTNVTIGGNTWVRQGSEYALLSSLGTASTKNTPASGNASGTEIVLGSDTRLTDPRTPTAHSHAVADLSGTGTVGRSVLAAESASTARTVLGAQSALGFTAEDSSRKSLDVSADGDSDTKYPSVKAVKDYTDQLVAGLPTQDPDTMVWKPAIDCSSSPNYPAANEGWVFRVSAEGVIGGGPLLKVNDLLICLVDATPSGTHGAVGSSWVVYRHLSGPALSGPLSSTDNHVVVFDGATGALVKDSGLTLGNSSSLDVGTTAGTVAAGNDARLSDARSPTAHSHAASEISGGNPVFNTIGFPPVANENSGASITVDMSVANFRMVTLTANASITFDFTGVPVSKHQVILKQDATGGWIPTFSNLSSSRWLDSATTPDLNTAANGESLLTIYYDGATATQSLSKIGAT